MTEPPHPAHTGAHYHDDDEPQPPTAEQQAAWEQQAAQYANPWDLPPIPTLNPPKPEVEGSDDDRSSWWPIDLSDLFAADHQPLTPTIFARDDGQHILYPGKAHAFNGESESGKSWAALHACAQTIREGRNVLYCDFEDTATTVVQRLLALGCDPQHVLAHFTYLEPHDPLWWNNKIGPGLPDLVEVITGRPYALAILDGVTEAMVLHGLDINSNNDVATFYTILPRRLKAEGATTAQIDHIPKNRENRGRGGIGGQHKLAGIDVSFVFEAVAPFGVGRHGISKISIEKDRPGQLRQHASGRRIADLHLDSDPETHALICELRAPEQAAPAASDQWEPTHLMEQVSAFVAQCNINGEHPSQKTIEEGVTGKRDYVRTALTHLIRDGYIGRGVDGRKTYQHTSLTQYQEEEAA